MMSEPKCIIQIPNTYKVEFELNAVDVDSVAVFHMLLESLSFCEMNARFVFDLNPDSLSVRKKEN